MHQITLLEPKWLSEVAPTFFRVADQNKISKRKASEKIEPLFDRFAANKDDWVSGHTVTLSGVAYFLSEVEQAKAGDTHIANFRLRRVKMVSICPEDDACIFQQCCIQDGRSNHCCAAMIADHLPVATGLGPSRRADLAVNLARMEPSLPRA